MIQIFDNKVNAMWRACWKYVSWLYAYLFLIFFVKQHIKEHENIHAIYYLILVKHKSGFLVVYILDIALLI